MPDFAKALRALNPDAPAAFSPRSLIQQLQFLKPRAVRPTSDNVLPPGEVHANSLGSHYFIHAVYPEDHYHGKVRLSRMSSSDLECTGN